MPSAAITLVHGDRTEFKNTRAASVPVMSGQKISLGFSFNGCYDRLLTGRRLRNCVAMVFEDSCENLSHIGIIIKR